MQGHKFVLGGKPYRFAGPDLWYGAYLGAKGGNSGRDRLKRELDKLHSLGLDNLGR